MAPARSIDALPPTTRWHCRPTLCRHPCGRLDRLTRRQTKRCCWYKSPLTTNGGAQCHRGSLRCLWHKRLHLAAWMGGWHPPPYPLGRQRHHIPLTAPCLLGAWGEYFPAARRYMPSVEVTLSGHPIAILEWAACASADTVSESVDEILAYWTAYAHPLEQALCSKQTCRNYCNIGGLPLYPEREMRVRCARWVCTYLAMSVSPSHPHHRMGGRSTGSMAPSPATTGAAMPSLSLACPSPPARSTPSHPKRTMGGSSKGSMAPSSAYSRMATPSPSSASFSLPAWFSPSPPIIMGEGASLVEHWAATVFQC